MTTCLQDEKLGKRLLMFDTTAAKSHLRQSTQSNRGEEVNGKASVSGIVPRKKPFKEWLQSPETHTNGNIVSRQTVVTEYAAAGLSSVGYSPSAPIVDGVGSHAHILIIIFHLNEIHIYTQKHKHVLV